MREECTYFFTDVWFKISVVNQSLGFEKKTEEANSVFILCVCVYFKTMLIFNVDNN